MSTLTVIADEIIERALSDTPPGSEPELTARQKFQQAKADVEAIGQLEGTPEIAWLLRKFKEREVEALEKLRTVKPEDFPAAQAALKEREWYADCVRHLRQNAVSSFNANRDKKENANSETY